MTLKRLDFFLCVTLLTGSWSLPASAGKIDVLFGGYQFVANNKRNNTSTTLSGAGSYHLGYRHGFAGRLELNAGYSLLAAKTIGGDLSFGFDLGVNYFPLTQSGPILADGANGTTATYQSLWRPFVGIAFHQRNFQSTSSQYAGTGVHLGIETPWRRNFHWLGMARYLTLSGPNRSTVNQTDILVGIMTNF